MHILWWLGYCTKIKFPNYRSGLDSECGDFFEILIYLFGKYTKELLHSSIYQKYIEVENELSNIRGRLDFNNYIINNLATARHHLVSCVYDSFEIDNEFNQCVKYVSRLLVSTSKNPDSIRNLNEILFLLDEVSDISISAATCRTISFNAMFAEFETIKAYCILFLENAISFNYKNEIKLIAFLLPMEYVFEDFIYGFIDKEIEGVNPKGQVTGTYLDEAKYFGLKPDLVLDLGDKEIIADTKYKMVYTNAADPKKGISQTDLYQMLSYAVRFKIKEIKLFYPSSNDIENPTSTIEIIDEIANKEKIIITAHQLPIIDSSITLETLSQHSKLNDNFNALKEKLKEKLCKILKF